MTKSAPTKLPFAAFDIDGTLIRWQLYHAVADELGQKGHISPEHYAKFKNARQAWKRREQGADFNSYEQSLVRAYQESIQSIAVADVEAAIDTVLAEYQDQTYTYTKGLIQSLKQQGYLLFALSGSQDVMVAKLAKRYGFDASYGTHYYIQDGVYTGESEVMRRDKKPEYLHKLVEQFDATYDASYAIGDSESDIPMLELAERPVAFNPSRALFEHAKKEGWQVVVERKDMIYQMSAEMVRS